MNMRIYTTFLRQKETRNILMCFLLVSIFLFLRSMPSANLDYHQDGDGFKQYANQVKMKFLGKGADDSLESQYHDIFQLEALYEIAQNKHHDVLDSEIFKIYEDALYRLEQAITLEEGIIEANIYLNNVEKVIIALDYIESKMDPSYFIGDSNKQSIRFYDVSNEILSYYQQGDFLSGGIYLWGELYIMSPIIVSLFGFTLLGMMLLIIHLEDKFYKKHSTLLHILPRKNAPSLRAMFNVMTVLLMMLLAYLISYAYMCISLEGGKYVGEFLKGIVTIFAEVTSIKMIQIIGICYLFCYSTLLMIDFTKKALIRNIILISIMVSYILTYTMALVYESATLIDKYNILLYLDFDKYITGFRESTLLNFEQFKFYSPNQVIVFLIGWVGILKYLKWTKVKLKRILI